MTRWRLCSPLPRPPSLLKLGWLADEDLLRPSVLTRADATPAAALSPAVCELTDEARERPDSIGVVGRDDMRAFSRPRDGVLRTFCPDGDTDRSMPIARENDTPDTRPAVMSLGSIYLSLINARGRVEATLGGNARPPMISPAQPDGLEYMHN